MMSSRGCPGFPKSVNLCAIVIFVYSRNFKNQNIWNYQKYWCGALYDASDNEYPGCKSNQNCSEKLTLVFLVLLVGLHSGHWCHRILRPTLYPLSHPVTPNPSLYRDRVDLSTATCQFDDECTNSWFLSANRAIAERQRSLRIHFSTTVGLIWGVSVCVWCMMKMKINLFGEIDSEKTVQLNCVN